MIFMQLLFGVFNVFSLVAGLLLLFRPQLRRNERAVAVWLHVPLFRTFGKVLLIAYILNALISAYAAFVIGGH